MGKSANEIVVVEFVQLAFSTLFVPKGFKGDTDPTKQRYSCSFLMSKTTEQGKANIATVEKAMKEVYVSMWPKDGPKLKPHQVCMRDGDDETYEGFAGNMYLSATSTKRPTVIDVDTSPLVEADDRPYSGCTVVGQATIWAQDNQYGQRINATLDVVQFISHGARSGSSSSIDTNRFRDRRNEVPAAAGSNSGSGVWS